MSISGLGWIGVTDLLQWRCTFYDAGKHDAYRSLEMKRSTIDAALGDQVSEWRPPGTGRPAGYVAPMMKYADPMGESDWETQFKWLNETLERFDRVFRPIVKRL